MKRSFFHIKDLKDSREFYESKPKAIGLIFLYVLISLIIAGVIFSFYYKKEVIIKTSADINYDKVSSSITNVEAGKVEEIKFDQVSKVEKGDLLLTLDDSDIEKQKEAVKKEIKEIKNQLKLNKTLKESVEKDSNLFEEEDKWGFRTQYLAFDKQILSIEDSQKKVETQKENLEKQKEKQKESLENSKSDTNLKINRLSNLQKAINNDDSFAKQDDKYSSLYDSYKSKKQNIENQIDNLKETKDDLDKTTYTQQKETLEGQLDTLKNDTLVQISEEKDNLNQMLSEIDVSIDNQEVNSEPSGVDNTNYELSKEQIKTNLLSQVAQKHSDLQSNLDIKQNNLDMLELQSEKYNIKATSDGYVNTITDIAAGDYLPAGTAILNIVPNKAELKAKIYIPSQEIVNIAVNDEVKFSIKNTNQTISSKIKNISPESISDPEGQKFYVAEAAIEDKEITQDNGDVLTIKNGMQTNASIIVDSQRYINYLLELLHF
jgi:membrane fusion protein, peptide pheromone/bacteriocin exporter